MLCQVNRGGADVERARGFSCGKSLDHNSGSSNSWLEIKCVGTVSNRSAIGTKVSRAIGNGLTQDGYGVWGIPVMKVTFELPPPVVQRLRAHIPSGERSRFVAELIAKALQHKGNALEQAAQKANRLQKVNRDMKDWEALNGYED